MISSFHQFYPYFSRLIGELDFTALEYADLAKKFLQTQFSGIGYSIPFYF